MSARHPHIKARVLTVFLLVGLPLLAIGFGIALAIGRQHLRGQFGQHLQESAQQTAAAVDAYVYRRLVDVSLLGRTPEVRRAAQAGSALPFDRAKVVTAGAAAASLDPPASKFLADIVAHDTVYRELVLTDRHGRVVAASGPPSTAFLGEADWWKAVTEDSGRGRVTMSDVTWDDRARIHAIAFAAPVPAPEGEALTGVLKVVVDSRELLAMVGGVQLGASGEAVLLRDNGSVVFARRQTDPNARFFALTPLLERVAVMRQGGPEAGTFFRAASPTDGSPFLVGLAASQLGRSYPNASWLVAVSQSEAELLAPVRALGWYLFAVIALVALLVLALALYFSMRLEAPQVDVDMHLVRHPPLAHVGDVQIQEEAGSEPVVVRAK
jgi:hypothetical protein